MTRHLRLWMLAALLWLPQAQAADTVGQAEPVKQSGLPVITVAELPAEARDALQTIKQGGPFAYDRDGAAFKNYERILPQQPRGYYREYTVKTPGARNRGARRIVCGPPVECYYTADHYQTFKRIRE
ncbi:MAG: ribonuclease domain-containing protein [Gallionella sp.]|nr:ribonuclease domain-containing protein [Gallionella sp.]